MSKFRLTIHADENAGDLDPFDQDSPLFKLHSFKRGDLHEDTSDLSLSEFADMEGYWLSHYEHGQRHWSIQGTVNYPDMQWDGVRTAGFLEVVVPDNEREWWNGRSEEDRLESAKITIAEYTSWINGEVYGYVLETIESETCNLGFVHESKDKDVDDSCFGFIGWDYFLEEVQRITDSEGATADNTEVVDEAYGMTNYGTLFKTAEVSA